MKFNKIFLKSLKIAIYGLKCAFKEEKNFRVQFLIGIIVIFFMIFFGLNPIEDSILILMILVVLSLELINSQIEKFLDLIQPDHHPKVKIIKDFSAGAVLLSAVGSIVIGILIFYPHIINFLSNR
jgi:diacylglycerol kinase